MDAKQFAWLYLVEKGHAGITDTYYGGYAFTEDAKLMLPDITKDRWSPKSIFQVQKFYEEQVKIVGVDWNKTKAPTSDFLYQFAGTFADSDHKKEILIGTLVLKNGVKQTWMAEALEVTNVFEMMAVASQAPEKFKNIFGV